MVLCVPIMLCWRSLWEHLSKVFSTYEVISSEDDLADHKAKLLESFLDEKPQKKRKAIGEDIGNTTPGFIVDHDGIDQIEDDGLNDEENLFDTVCSFCDNGGELLW